MSSTPIGISYIDYYIPKTTVSVDEVFALMEDQGLIAYPENSSLAYADFVAELKSKIECKNIPTELDKTTYDMMNLLLEKYFDLDRSKDIDLIIFTGSLNPLKDKFNIPHKLIEKYCLEDAMIIEVGNRCCSISSAIQVAKKFLKANDQNQRAMILSQNHIRSMAERFHQGNSIEGDGSSILVIEPSDINIALDYTFMNSGKFHAYLFDNTLDCISSHFFQYVVSSATIIDKLMKKHGIDAAEIEGIIIQNINSVIPRMISKKVKIDYSKIYTRNISRYGHLADVDFIVNLKDFLKEHRGGGKLICQNTGAGLTADATLIENAWSTE